MADMNYNPTAMKYYYSGGGTESYATFAYFRSGYRNRFTMPDPSTITIDFNRALFTFQTSNPNNASNYWNDVTSITWYCTPNTYTDAAGLPTNCDYKTRTYTCKLMSANNHRYSFDISELVLYAKQHYSGNTWYLWCITSQTGSSGVPEVRNLSQITLQVDNEGQRDFPEFGVTATSAGGVSPYVRQGTEWKPVKEVYVYKDGTWTKSSVAVRADDEWKAGKFESNYTDADDFSGWPATKDDFVAYYPDGSTTGACYDRDITACDSTYASDNINFRAAQVFAGSGNSTLSWISASNDATSHWIQIKLPEYAYNVKVAIKNGSVLRDNTVNGAIAGEFLYDSGCSLLSDIADLTSTGVTFSGRDGQTVGAYTVHSLNNKYPIRVLCIKVTDWYKISSTYKYVRIGELKIKYDTKAE